MAAYRSALTLDWRAKEAHRRRELAVAFKSEVASPLRPLATDCIEYPKPAAGKVARLMLDLLTNLEGDEVHVISELIQTLVRSKLLVETAMLDAEPDLDALLKTQGVMRGEPHTTFPRIVAMVWMSATDPATTKRHGWCPITKVTKYLSIARSEVIAHNIRTLEPVITRGRYIMEEFIQQVTPLNVYDHKNNFGYRTTKGLGLKSSGANRTKRIKKKHKNASTPISDPEPKVMIQHSVTQSLEYDVMGSGEVIHMVEPTNGVEWINLRFFVIPIAFAFKFL